MTLSSAPPLFFYAASVLLRRIVVVQIVLLDRIDLEIALEVVNADVKRDGVERGDGELEDIAGEDEKGELAADRKRKKQAK